MDEEDIHHQHQCSHVISPLPSNCSDNSSQEGDSDFDNKSESMVDAFKYASSSEDDSNSVLDESELGEFLMDTFEGLDSFEVNGIMATSV